MKSTAMSYLIMFWMLLIATVIAAPEGKEQLMGRKMKKETKSKGTKAPKKTKAPKTEKKRKQPKISKAPKKDTKVMYNVPTKLTTEPTMQPILAPTAQKNTMYPSMSPTSNDYPDCVVPNRTSVGDGWCDGYPYDTPQCGFDGGDCPNIYPECLLYLDNSFGDGHCDEIFDTRECGFDDGDCLNQVTVNATVNYPNCSVEMPSYLGNGYCDGYNYNTSECGFDGGDCLNFTGNATTTASRSTFDSFDERARSLLERVLNYFYPVSEDEQLDWQR